MRPAEISLKDAIDRLLHNYKLKSKVQEIQLVESWGNIVGKMIENHTRDVQLRNGKLYVKLDSAVVRQELMYARTKLIEKVNQELGGQYVEEIILQ